MKHSPHNSLGTPRDDLPPPRPGDINPYGLPYPDSIGVTS